MSLNTADVDALLAYCNALLGSLRPLLEADPLLQPWIAELERTQRQLRAWSRSAANPGAAPPAIDPLDLRAEPAVRALRYMLQARIQWLRSRGEDAAAADLEALNDQLFAEGLSFLQRPADVQVAAARRLVEQARQPERQALLAPLSLGDASANDLLLQIEATHDALQAALDARRDAATEAPAPSLQPLRREAISLLTDLRRLIDRRSQEPARTRLLAAFG